MTAPESVRHISRLPVPQSVWLRIVAFLVPGRYGRIELDVSDGRVIACRFVESFRVRGDEALPEPLREVG
jgi:hypothetical protein